MRPHLVSFLVAIFGLALAGSARAVTFADGALHVIDAANSFPSESAIVNDGPGGATTSVDLTTGGAIATTGGSGLEAFGTSNVSVTGGSLGGFLSANDDSVVSISATGTANTFGVQATDQAQVTLSGGRIDDLFVSGNAQFTMSGGEVNPSDIQFFGNAVVNISDGIFNIGADLRAAQNAVVTISGGSGVNTPLVAAGGSIHLSGGIYQAASASAGGSFTMTDGELIGAVGGVGAVEILGGVVGTAVIAGGSGTALVAGGQIGGPLRALDIALIEIVGSGFNLPLGDILALSGTLTGVLSDGTPIDTSFDRASTARITLIPEPASAAQLALGLLVLAAARARRRPRRSSANGARGR